MERMEGVVGNIFFSKKRGGSDPSKKSEKVDR